MILIEQQSKPSQKLPKTFFNHFKDTLRDNSAFSHSSFSECTILVSLVLCDCSSIKNLVKPSK